MPKLNGGYYAPTIGSSIDCHTYGRMYRGDTYSNPNAISCTYVYALSDLHAITDGDTYNLTYGNSTADGYT